MWLIPQESKPSSFSGLQESLWADESSEALGDEGILLSLGLALRRPKPTPLLSQASFYELVSRSGMKSALYILQKESHSLADQSIM